MNLVEISAKTRGKNTREVSYKGIGKFVEEPTGETKKVKDALGVETEVPVTEKRLIVPGVLTDPKEALALVGGDMQKMLDMFAIGYNLEAYRQVSDVLAEFINPEWTEVQTAAFRLAVNNLVKIGASLDKAVAAAIAFIPAKS